MGCQDIVLAKKETRTELKQLAEKNRKLLSLMDYEASTSKAVLSSNSSGSYSQVESTDSDDQVVFKDNQNLAVRKRVRGTKKAITSTLAASLDRTQVSDRKATMIITEAIRSLGSDPAEFNINRDSIRRENKSQGTFCKQSA